MFVLHLLASPMHSAQAADQEKLDAPDNALLPVKKKVGENFTV
jgi:hypothetical protein